MDSTLKKWLYLLAFVVFVIGGYVWFHSAALVEESGKGVAPPTLSVPKSAVSEERQVAIAKNEIGYPIDVPLNSGDSNESSVLIPAVTGCSVLVNLENGLEGLSANDLPGYLELQSITTEKIYRSPKNKDSNQYLFNPLPEERYRVLSKPNELFLYIDPCEKKILKRFPEFDVTMDGQITNLRRIQLTPVIISNANRINDLYLDYRWYGRDLILDEVAKMSIPPSFLHKDNFLMVEWMGRDHVHYVIPGPSEFIGKLEENGKFVLLGRQQQRIVIPAQDEVYEVKLDFSMGGSVRGLIDSPLYDGYNAYLHPSDVVFDAPKEVVITSSTDVVKSEFLIEHIKPGEYFVRINKGFKTEKLLSPVFSVKEGEETVVKIKTERAEAGVFSCTVTERNGLPIRNTKFMLYQDSYLTEAISDETGVLTIPYRKAYSMEGTLRIQANDGTINPMEGGAVAISLQETPNSTICFPQLTRQTVFIVDEEGKPVEYAELTIERDTNSIARSAMNFRCPEGEAGKYTFEVVPVGESYFYLTTFEKRVADTTYFQTPVVEPVYIDSVTNFRNVIAKQEITGDGDLYLTWHKPKTIEFHFVDQNNNPVPRILLFQIPLTYNRWNGNDFRFWLNEVEMSTTRIQMTGKDCWSDKDGTANFPLQSGMYPLIGFYHENYGLGFVQEDGQREGERLIRLRPACQVSMPPLDKIGFRYLAVMVEDGAGNAVSFVWSWSPPNESSLLFQPDSWQIASFQTDTEYPFILSRYPSMVNQVEWKQWNLSPNQKVEFPMKLILRPDNPFLRRQQQQWGPRGWQ